MMLQTDPKQAHGNLLPGGRVFVLSSLICAFLYATFVSFCAPTCSLPLWSEFFIFQISFYLLWAAVAYTYTLCPTDLSSFHTTQESVLLFIKPLWVRVEWDLQGEHGLQGPSWHFFVAILQSKNNFLCSFITFIFQRVESMIAALLVTIFGIIFILALLHHTVGHSLYLVFFSSILVLGISPVSRHLLKKARNGPRVTREYSIFTAYVKIQLQLQPQMSYARAINAVRKLHILHAWLCSHVAKACWPPALEAIWARNVQRSKVRCSVTSCSGHCK